MQYASIRMADGSLRRVSRLVLVGCSRIEQLKQSLEAMEEQHV